MQPLAVLSILSILIVGFPVTTLGLASDPAEPANLVVNPGFEFGTLSGPILGWTEIPGVGDAARSSVERRSGDHSLQLLGASPHDALAAGVRSDPILLDGSANVRVSAWIMDLEAPARVRIDFFDFFNRPVLSADLPAARPGAWDEVATETSAPATATYAKIVVLVGARTLSWVDDVSLVVLPAGPTVIAEDWDDGLSGWTVLGSGATTPCDPIDGCRLSLDPSCCGTYLRVERNDLALALDRPVVVSTLFRGPTTGGNTDAAMVVTFSDTSFLTFYFTEGANNGFSFDVTEDRQVIAHTEFYQWTQVDEWYEARLVIDPATRTVRGEAYDADGAFLAASQPLGLPTDASAVTKLHFFGVEWSSEDTTHEFDRLRVSHG